MFLLIRSRNDVLGTAFDAIPTHVEADSHIAAPVLGGAGQRGLESHFDSVPREVKEWAGASSWIRIKG